MDVLSVRPITWRAMPAWLVSAAHLELVVTATGGHLAALRARGDDLNPLWQPPWPAADPAHVDGGGAYGPEPAAKLLAAIVGHNSCLDRFGAPWPGEGRPLHGESGVVTWSHYQPSAYRVEWTAWLPETRLRLRKTIEIDGDAVSLTHGVAHDDPAARAVEWCEHVNVGGALLDGVRFAAGIDRVVNWPHLAEPDSRFADVAPEGELDPERALAFPANDARPCGDVLCARVVSGWWAASNERLRRRLAYRWDQRDYPWLALWTQHRSRTVAPWNGQGRVRGMEFSTKPWPEGKPPASRAEIYQGRPTTCLVPPGSWREHAMEIVWERW